MQGTDKPAVTGADEVTREVDIPAVAEVVLNAAAAHSSITSAEYGAWPHPYPPPPEWWYRDAGTVNAAPAPFPPPYSSLPCESMGSNGTEPDNGLNGDEESSEEEGDGKQRSANSKEESSDNGKRYVPALGTHVAYHVNPQPCRTVNCVADPYFATLPPSPCQSMQTANTEDFSLHRCDC